MYKGLKVLLMAPVFDEEDLVRHVIERAKASVADEVVIYDDGSSDNTPNVIKSYDVTYLGGPPRRGVGHAILQGIKYAQKEGFDVIAIMAGNNKDNPDELPRLLDPLAEGGFAFIQGSRYLASNYKSNMPLYRKLATRLHPLLFSLCVGKWITESTNGFRAFRLAMLEDKRINLDQAWLYNYELEPYLLYKTIVCGHKHGEVPVTKIYPKKTTTKMVPFISWWSILRPLLFLRLGIRK